MAMGWYERVTRQNLLEERRCRKLAEKLQKARAVGLRGEVLAEPTWGRRFGHVARLRAVGGEGRSDG